MRTEQQVLDQLLTFAQNDERVRAVVINGSRANPNAPKDLFCDYDVVYFVPDPGQFLRDRRWISTFGELIILQQNDDIDHGFETHIFLMLFNDGVRIDLYFNHIANLQYITDDSMTAVLLDKDGRAPAVPPPSDSGYLVTRPTRKAFDETINEIFWCSNNLAKGIWRDELPYVKFMYDSIIRICIINMLSWYAAMQHDWAIDTGKFGKWLKKFLPPEIWESYLKTYDNGEYKAIWDALFEACALTRKTGLELAGHLGYNYPLDDDRRVVEYLRRVRALPKDAVSFEE